MATIRKWKRIRQETIKKLIDLAVELEGIEKKINIAKTTGATTASVCGVWAVIAGVGAFFTGGLLTPVAVALSTGALAGGATQAGASLVKYIKDSTHIDDAQKAVDEDAKITEELRGFLKNMEREYSKIKGSRKLDVDRVQVVGGITKVVKATETLAHISSKLGPEIAKIVATGGGDALSTAGRVFGTIGKISRIAGPILGAVVIPFDIYNLFKSAIALDNGSPNEVAVELRKHSDSLKRQYQKFINVLDEIQQLLDSL